MDLKSRRFADTLVLSPAGRIDHATAADFRQVLLAEVATCAPPDKGRIVIDFAGVDYIASVGLRALVVASKQAKAQECTLVLAALQPFVREIFEISKFTLVFTIHGTLREALAETSPPALAAFERA
jgi:anti-sigma B factor antagonist